MTAGRVAAADSGWRFDSLGLGYTAQGGRIEVHYPAKEAEGSVQGRYGASFDLGPIPRSYWSDPPNAITRERVALWRELLDADSGRG